jgi:hypothetical protein
VVLVVLGEGNLRLPSAHLPTAQIKGELKPSLLAISMQSDKKITTQVSPTTAARVDRMVTSDGTEYARQTRSGKRGRLILVPKHQSGSWQ